MTKLSLTSNKNSKDKGFKMKIEDNRAKILEKIHHKMGRTPFLRIYRKLRIIKNLTGLLIVD